MGFHASPLDFPPYKYFGQGRFDGPPKLFRTLYCAENSLTSLRETLIKFRPDVASRIEFARFGRRSWPDVSAVWRRENVLISASLEIFSGELWSLADQSLLISLEIELADLLVKLKIEHLTLGVLQEDKRGLTQAIARALYARGAAGVLFPSKYDGKWNAGLFEGRAGLVARSSPQSLTEDHPDLLQVCDEYGMVLEPV